MDIWGVGFKSEINCNWIFEGLDTILANTLRHIYIPIGIKLDRFDLLYKGDFGRSWPIFRLESQRRQRIYGQNTYCERVFWIKWV